MKARASKKKKKPAPADKPSLKDLGILSSAFEQTADHVVITDVEGVILYVNPAFERTTGYSYEETLGKTPRIIKSGRYDQQFYENLWQTILGGDTFQETIANKKKSGEIYWSDQTITPIKDAGGKITHFISIWKDVTDRIHAREELNRLHDNLKKEKQKLEKILNFGEEIEHIHNFHKLVDFIVESAASILESERCSLMLLDEYKGELCIKAAVGLEPDVVKTSKLHSGEGVAGLVMKEGKPMLVKVIDDDYRVGRGNHPYYDTKSFLSVPIKFDHKLMGVLNITGKNSDEGSVYTQIDMKILMTIVRQVAIALENAQLSKEVKYLTVTDQLTSLYNHRYLMECLAYEIRRYNRFHRALSLMIMDIDDLKDYNDKYGHHEGDFVLKKVAETLRSTLREVDVVCRYAGDEFVAILPETNEQEAVRLGNLIKSEVKKVKMKRKITMSMGIVKCTQKMTRHDFISSANAALHKAKQDGKDRICCHNQTE